MLNTYYFWIREKIFDCRAYYFYHITSSDRANIRSVSMQIISSNIDNIDRGLTAFKNRV